MGRVETADGFMCGWYRSRWRFAGPSSSIIVNSGIFKGVVVFKLICNSEREGTHHRFFCSEPLRVVSHLEDTPESQVKMSVQGACF